MGGLLHVLAKGAGIIGQDLENAQNPQEVVQRQTEARQHQQGQQDQWKQVQQGIAQGIVNNPNATPEQKTTGIQRMAQIFGQPGMTPEKALQMIQGYASPEQVKGAEAEKLQSEKLAAQERIAKEKPQTQLRTRIIMSGDKLPNSAVDMNGDSIEGDKNSLWQLDPFGRGWYQIPGNWQTKVVGNREYRINPQTGEQVLVTDEEGQPFGPVKLPTQKTSTQTSPGGKQVVSGTSVSTPGTAPLPVSSNTPVAPGQGPGAPVPPGEPPNPKLHVRPQPGAPVSSKTPQPGKTQSILPDIQNMTPQNATRAAKAQPAVTALLGLYGDPEHPEVKSMADYASLASNPHAQKVLGVAFKMLDQDMGEITDPGVIATLMTAGGWQNFRANAEAQAQRQTGQAMTAEEKEYFDTAIASMADIIGSRAATGQSPARFSVKSIQNELPLIGTSSVTDPKSYLTKMGTIARQIEVGLNSMPDNARAMKYLQKRVNDLIQQSNQYSKKLNPGGVHQYAIDDSGKRRKVLDPNAKLPQGWKWAE